MEAKTLYKGWPSKKRLGPTDSDCNQHVFLYAVTITGIKSYWIWHDVNFGNDGHIIVKKQKASIRISWFTPHNSVSHTHPSINILHIQNTNTTSETLSSLLKDGTKQKVTSWWTLHSHMHFLLGSIDLHAIMQSFLQTDWIVPLRQWFSNFLSSSSQTHPHHILVVKNRFMIMIRISASAMPF